MGDFHKTPLEEQLEHALYALGCELGRPYDTLTLAHETLGLNTSLEDSVAAATTGPPLPEDIVLREVVIRKRHSENKFIRIEYEATHTLREITEEILKRFKVRRAANAVEQIVEYCQNEYMSGNGLDCLNEQVSIASLRSDERSTEAQILKALGKPTRIRKEDVFLLTTHALQGYCCAQNYIEDERGKYGPEMVSRVANVIKQEMKS